MLLMLNNQNEHMEYLLIDYNIDNLNLIVLMLILSMLMKGEDEYLI